MTVYVVLIDIPEEPSVKVFKTLEVARIYANETVGEYTGVGVKMKQYAIDQWSNYEKDIYIEIQEQEVSE